MTAAGLISMGAYLPGKEITEEKRKPLVDFLRKETQLYPEYIAEIETTGRLPGKAETNYDGWESQPWFQTWLEQLPPKSRSNPFRGTKERRIVPLDPVSVRRSLIPHPMLPSDAETIAGALAIFNGEISKSQIDLVLVNSMVPDRNMPSNASLVQEKLKLPHPGAYGVNSCCSSFVTALQIAEGLVIAGIKNTVLIVASHLCSHCRDKSDYFSPDLGDAAVAGIVSKVEKGFGYVASHSISDGSRHRAIVLQRRSPWLSLPSAANEPSYEQEYLTFADLDLCKDIAIHMQEDLLEVVQAVLRKAALSTADIDLLTTHQPVDWAPDAWREAIGVPREKFYETFERYGNIASCSTAVNLFEALERGMVSAGGRAMITSSGAGNNQIALLEKIAPELVKATRNV